MTDTRKDKRAPLSLKVRFKSATVDEFIEQYATDISRGGIYIKSKQPMPIGTLLKFEFQLKDESKLIQGVGRVVWKREAGEGATDANPSGMGIKFIKMDPESKALVEQIVAGRGEAPGQYEAGGGAAATTADEDVATAATTTAAAPGEAKRPIRSAKATMQFFPSTTPQNEMPPPEDRTQVRHASEFLASALSSAGADEATSGEADKSADEARKRTEEIERQREEQQKKAREEEASKARAEKDRQEREKAEAARADEEKAAAEKKAKEPAKEAPAEAKGKFASEPPPAKAAARASERPAAKAAEKKAEPAAKKPATAEKKSDGKAVAAIDRPAPEEPQSNTIWIFAAVAAVALVGSYFAFGRGGATETDELPPPPPPVVVEDTPPPPVVEDTPPPVVEPEVVPEVVAVPEEPPAPTFDVAVATTPPGATIFVDGAPSGTSPATVQMTEGAHAVEARLAGYRTATAEATGGPSARAVRMTLAALPYAVTVTTSPPGARVRIGSRTVVAPGRTEIPRPTAPLTARAVLAGFVDGSATIAPTEFVASEDAMTAEISIVLTPRPVAPIAPVTPRVPRTPRPPPEEGTTTTTTPADPPADPPPAEEHHEAPPPPPPAEEAPPDNPF